MRFFYDIFFIVFAVFYVPFMAVKGKFHPGFSEKFARYPEYISDIKKPVWIHAVSVGEALVAARLCERIKSRFPGTKVVVSTTTRTGNEMIKKEAKNVDGVFYYPIDLRGVVKKAIRKIDPSVYVIVETELWPNMLAEAFSRSIPVVLANGRISDRSFGGYSIIRPVMRKMLGCFSALCVQTARDAEKMKALGCDVTRISVTGNIKFDTPFSSVAGAEVEKIQSVFTRGRKIIVAGSTHFPEERWIIKEFVSLPVISSGVKLIIAPRHIERKEAVRIYAENAGLKCCFFSDMISDSPGKAAEADVMVVDTIGHLKDIYSLASVVFIGGSLVKKGGQNPIEAARWGKSVIFGPNMDNFREVARDFVESSAAVMVRDPSGMGSSIADILNDDKRRREMENNSRTVIAKNSGALDMTVDVIGRLKGK